MESLDYLAPARLPNPSVSHWLGGSIDAIIDVIARNRGGTHVLNRSDRGVLRHAASWTAADLFGSGCPSGRGPDSRGNRVNCAP
jgi:hypothetical protein